MNSNTNTFGLLPNSTFTDERNGITLTHIKEDHDNNELRFSVEINNDLLCIEKQIVQRDMELVAFEEKGGERSASS